MLVEERVTAGLGVEEGHPSDAVQDDHQEGDREPLGEEQGHPGGDEHGPDEDGEAPPGHPRGAHVDDGDNEVQAAKDGGEPEGDDREVEQDLGAVGGGGERRVGGPAGLDAADKRRRHEGQGDGRDEPEGERVEPREGHVIGADEERDGVVPGAADDGRDSDGDHQDAVEAHGAVVLAGADELHPALCQLQAHPKGDEAREEEHADERHQVLDADDFVVGIEGEVALPAGGDALVDALAEPLACPGAPHADAHEPGEEPEDVPGHDVEFAAPGVIDPGHGPDERHEREAGIEPGKPEPGRPDHRFQCIHPANFLPGSGPPASSHIRSRSPP